MPVSTQWFQRNKVIDWDITADSILGLCIVDFGIIAR